MNQQGLKWKGIVRSKLFQDQEGKCADCGEPITSEWQKYIKFKIPPHGGGSTTDYNNLKLVHRNCNVIQRKQQNDRATIIAALIEKGISFDKIARALGISVRTVYRYVPKPTAKSLLIQALSSILSVPGFDIANFFYKFLVKGLDKFF